MPTRTIIIVLQYVLIIITDVNYVKKWTYPYVNILLFFFFGFIAAGEKKIKNHINTCESLLKQLFPTDTPDNTALIQNYFGQVYE